MKRQPNTRQKIIAAGIYLALADAENLEPGSAARVGRWLDLRSGSHGPRCIAVGRVTGGGSIQMWTSGDEYQFQIISDEKLCKPGLSADPDHLVLEVE